MSKTEVAARPREVTDDEAAFYEQNGWVKLERFVEPALAAEMLEAVTGVMGERPSEEDVVVGVERGAASGNKDARDYGGGVKNIGYWQDYHFIARDRQLEPLRTLIYSKEIGRAAQKLIGRDVDVRQAADLVACKMPAGQAGSDPTDWHQDIPSLPFDRIGGFAFWIALNDCPPERGSMRFLSVSQREGSLGRTRAQGKSVIDYYPRLLERYDMSPPLDLKAGDATAHNAYVCHGAPANTTDTPRWAFICTYIPGDTLWTGASNYNYDDIGLEVGKPFDHPRFPVVYP
jgi:ectoine hydroxylase-related dioxygenase (phytanoyl-CoA dioxygenase family)